MGKRYNRIKKLVREDRTPYTGKRDLEGGWRKKILSESDWTPVAGSTANSTSQTFVHPTGATTTVSGLGGVETTPSTVTIDAFGDRFDVPAPEYGQYGLQGYAPPLGKKVMRRDAEQNKERVAEIDERLKELTSKEYKVESDFYNKWDKIKAALPPMPKSLGQYMRLDPVKALASWNLNVEERDYLKALVKYEKDFESAKKNDLGKKLDTITKEREALEKEYDYLLGMTPDVNSQLDASQEFAQQVGADEFMNARVQSGEFTPEQQAAIDAWNAELRATMDRHGREWEAVLKKDGGYNPEKHKGLQARQGAEMDAIWNKEPKFDDAPSFNYDPSKTPFGADYGEVSQVIDGEKLLPQELQDILNRRRGKSPALGGTFTKDEKKRIANFMATKGHDLLIKDPDTYDRLERILTNRTPFRNLYPGKTPQPQDYYGNFLRGGGMIDPSAYGRVLNPTVPGVKNYKPGYVPYPNPNNYKPVSAGEKAYVRSLQVLPGLVNVVSTILGNDEGSAATPADWALQYARGDYTPITKSPGRAFNKNTMELISIALDSPNNTSRGSVQTHTYNDRKTFDYIRDTSIRNSLGQFNYRATANGIEITDTFNFNGNTSIGALGVVDDIIGRATGGVVDEPIQRNADKLVDIGYRAALEKGQNPADDKHGIPIKYTIPWSEVPAKLQNKLDPNQRLVPIVKKRNRRGGVVESTWSRINKYR